MEIFGKRLGKQSKNSEKVSSLANLKSQKRKMKAQKLTHCFSMTVCRFQFQGANKGPLNLKDLLKDSIILRSATIK